MKRSDLFFLLLSVLIASVGVVALLKPGFFLTDDGNSMVIRFSAFYETLRSGQFPVRFLSRLNFGYGYPVPDFLYPLFMYIGVPIKALGFSFVETIKIIIGISFISGTIFSFLWLRKLFDEKCAFVGSVVYSLFPYHLYDIYKRGSVGEVLALGIVPFVLWQIERRSFIWTSIGLSFLILSHNTLAVLFLIFLVFYALLDVYVAKDKINLGKFYIFSFLIGLGSSSFFSIPAIFDLQYTVFSKIQVSDWSRYFITFDLVGILSIAILFIVFFYFLLNKNQLRKHRLTILILSSGLISIFFASSASSSLWHLLPVSFIQFPFRFLSLTVLSVAFLASFISSLTQTQKVGTGAFIFILISISLGITHYTPLTTRNFLGPEIFQDYPDSFYSTNQDSTTVKNEYMPKWVKKNPSEMALSKIQNLNGEEKVNIKEATANKISFNTFLAKGRVIRVNIVYFPGWTAYVNGVKSNIIYDDGLINIKLNQGKNDVLIKFEETPVRLVADLISAVSLLVLMGLYFKKLKFIEHV